ncbi:VCBS repeat-containing protein [Alphaproteobacteria bacterium]|nr:VCBS repeat-containing protein [Alphaproteobacteria bacterium]
MSSFAEKSFFKDISNLLPDQKPRLSYGVAVTDFDNDGSDEFIVTGFGYENLALGYDGSSLKNKIKENIFSDFNRSTIGVAACDIDKDGHEEIYFLNTDTYSGQKMYSDRLLKLVDKNIEDLFEKDINQDELNLTAGRSVVCVDREGKGNYGIYVANYGGPTRFYEYIDNRVVDLAESLKLDEITGGRAVVAGHIISDQIDIFAANERGPNFFIF